MSEQANAERVAVDPTQLRLTQVGAGDDLVLRYPLSPDRADAPQILAFLKQFTIIYGRSPYVREFTRRILPPFTRPNDLEAILRVVTEFVRDKLVYLPDPAGAEYIISPVTLLQLIEEGKQAFGDCDDHVLLHLSMLNSVGFETRVVGVHLQDPELWDHVISGVRINGRWLDIDTCLDSTRTPIHTQKLIS